MPVSDYLDESRVRLDVELRSKKHALQSVSELIADGSDGLAPSRVFDALFQRERIGCTAIGNGVALPHARLRNASECVAAFLRCAEPVDFDADDGTPVHMVFAVVFPEASGEETVYNLSHIAALFEDAALRHELMEASSAEQALSVIVTAAARAPNDPDG